MIRQICFAAFFGTALLAPAVLVWAGEPRFERTTVAIDGIRWLINGCVTYPVAKAEGLLMNVRMVNALKQYGKPIVCNEDDKTGQAAAEACRLSVENGASYGLMLKLHNQYQPFEFHGVADDPTFYSMLRSLTTQSN